MHQKPLLFSSAGIGAIIVAILAVQAAYIFDTKVVFTHTDYLASVLPSVLATLANEDRAQSGAPALTVDPLLAQAAQAKANDMATRGYFSHVDPDGHSPWYWFQQSGYKYTYAGENLAVNFTDSKDVEAAWMASPAHHANIVKPQYTRVGIGVAKGKYEGRNATFVVQFFATPPASVPFQGAAAGSNFFAKLVTSPTYVIIYVLSAISVFLCGLVLATLRARTRPYYLEVLSSVMFTLIVSVSLLMFDVTAGSIGNVPDGAQSAAAIEAF